MMPPYISGTLKEREVVMIKKPNPLPDATISVITTTATAIPRATLKPVNRNGIDEGIITFLTILHSFNPSVRAVFSNM